MKSSSDESREASPVPEEPRVARANRAGVWLVGALFALVWVVATIVHAQKKDTLAQASEATGRQLRKPAENAWFKDKEDVLPQFTLREEPKVVLDKVEPEELPEPAKEISQKEKEALLARALITVKKPPHNISSTKSSHSPQSLNQSSTPAQSSESVPGDQNLQARKESFLKLARNSSVEFYNTELLKEPISKYEVKAGSIIPGILITGINSDLPGEIIAQVREAVYDSVTGRHLLIPQGAKLFGKYDSVIAYGQSRAMVVWDRLIFPDGRSMALRGMQGAGPAGQSGFKDKVNHHYMRIFGSAILLGLVGAGTELLQPDNASAFSAETPQQQVAEAVGNSLAEVTTEMIRRNMAIQPTIEIRPGYRFNILVNKDLVLPEPYIESLPARDALG